MLLHRFETIFSLAEMVNVNRNVEDDDEEGARKAASLAIDRVLRPVAANRTISRFKSRCNVTGERQRVSSTLRSFRRRRTSLASGIIPILNHNSCSTKSGY